MKFQLCFLFLSLSIPNLYSADRKVFYPYSIDSTVYQPSLPENESIFSFTFYDNSGQLANDGKHTITYAFDGTNKTVVLDKKNHFDLKVLAGKYSFQFFYSSDYFEITTKPITIKKKYKTYISCYLTRAEDGPVELEKPVIYLYPETPTLIEVKIELKGDLQFTYPPYNDGWKVNAHPSGELTIENQRYNYLFWEGTKPQNEIPFDKHNGFIVESQNVVEFLEAKLSTFGLNSKEQADFITYWGPQLMRNPKNFVHFVYNEQCDDFAELIISPKPDHVNRIYIVFTSNFDEENLIYKEQVIPKMQRDGFTVVEWGGSNLTKENFYQTKLN